MKTMQISIVSLLALIHLVIGANLLHAQGTAFTYQGRLNDGAGPANGNYDFRFRLASDPLANNYVGSNVFTSAVPISNGLFIATLDFAGAFNGSNYWLEIAVRTNGGVAYTTLSPLQPLTPAPYAVFAAGASNVLGVIPSGGLSGSYSGAVTFNNPANTFSGNGGGLTNLNGAGIQSGTVNSNALDAATKALLGAAYLERLFSTPTRLVFDGDSLTTTNFDGYPTYLMQLLAGLPRALFGMNTALGGETVVTMLANYTNNVQWWKPAGGTNAIYFNWCMFNDLVYNSNTVAQIFNNHSNLFYLAKRDGFTTVGFLMPQGYYFGSSVFEFSPQMSEINNLLLKYRYCDYVVDLNGLFPVWRSENYAGGVGVHFTAAQQSNIARQVFLTLHQPPKTYKVSTDIGGRTIQSEGGVIARSSVVGTPALKIMRTFGDASTNIFEVWESKAALFWERTLRRATMWAVGRGFITTAGNLNFTCEHLRRIDGSSTAAATSIPSIVAARI